MIRDIRKSIVRIKSGDSLGSGFFIRSTSGQIYILTCEHVVKDPLSLSAKSFSSKTNRFSVELETKLLVKYNETDGGVAILECKTKIEADDILPVEWGFHYDQTIPVITYGFPVSGQINGEISECEIVSGEFLDDFHVPKFKLRNSNDISYGYSGAPIVDKSQSKIIGMLGSVRVPDALSRGINSAYGTSIIFIRSHLEKNQIDLVNEKIDNRSGQTVITVKSPLIVGMLFDVSRTNIHNLDTIFGKIENSKGVSTGILALKRKIISFCKSPNTGKILPLVKLFLFGSGFGQIERQVLSFLDDIGLVSSEIEKVSSNNVRNLFARAKNEYDLTDVPTATLLNDFWSKYSECLSANLLDAGWEKSNFSLAFEEICKRYYEEVQGNERFSYLLFLTDGEGVSTELEVVTKHVNLLKQRNVKVIVLYCSPVDSLPKRRLLNAGSSEWPKDLQKLFDLASRIDTNDKLQGKITRYATNRGWAIPNNSKLIYQVTSEETISDILDIIFTPLSKK